VPATEENLAKIARVKADREQIVRAAEEQDQARIALEARFSAAGFDVIVDRGTWVKFHVADAEALLKRLEG